MNALTEKELRVFNGMSRVHDSDVALVKDLTSVKIL